MQEQKELEEKIAQLTEQLTMALEKKIEGETRDVCVCIASKCVCTDEGNPSVA